MPRPYRIKVGERFERLTVITLNVAQFIKGKRFLSLCRCDCGTERAFPNAELIRAGVKSCGCLNDWHNTSESAFRRLYSARKSTAKITKREFKLSKKQFKKLTVSNCHYCGKEPANKITPRKSNVALYYNGIDRVDNSLGYTIKNCVSCCKTCNFMKHKLTLTIFLEHCKLVTDRNNKKTN